MIQNDLLNGLINPRADWHLQNWRDWQSRYHLGGGYPGHSAMLATGGVSGEDAFQHLCDQADTLAAKITDAIVSDMEAIHQTAIHHFYCARIWRFRTDPMELLTAAVGEYWRKATKQGLS
jgi:hypothetical protein